jgi:hypothetical protein
VDTPAIGAWTIGRSTPSRRSSGFIRHPSGAWGYLSGRRPPPLPNHRRTEVREVVGPEVGHPPPLAELLDEKGASLLVVLPRAAGQFPGIDQSLLGVQELVHEFLQGRRPRLVAGLVAGVEGFLLAVVLRECPVGVRPGPEVVEFAPDLFRPHAGGVREEREVR